MEVTRKRVLFADSYEILVLVSLWTALVQPTVSPPSHAGQGGLRYTIAVESFENHSNWSGQIEIGQQLAVVLTDILSQSQHFIVLGESEMRAKSLEEQDLAASGRAASGNNTPVTGHLAPAQLLVRGAITHVQAGTASDQGGLGLGGGVRIKAGRKQTQISATFYIVDSSTGQVVASKSVDAKANSFGMGIRREQGERSGEYAMKREKNLMKVLRKAAKQAVDWMSGQLGDVLWQGQVVLVDKDSIIINRGSREGVTPNMKLVAGLLKTIRDPTTGEILDQRLEKELASLQVARVREKTSICRVIAGDVRRIRRNTTVLLPTSP